MVHVIIPLWGFLVLVNIDFVTTCRIQQTIQLHRPMTVVMMIILPPPPPPPPLLQWMSMTIDL